MNYERLRRNIECSLLSIISEATGSVLSMQQSKDSSDEIIKLVKAENTTADLPKTKSLVEANNLLLQVSRVVHRWKCMDDSSACCINYEDRIYFYNEYWQKIVDIVKQSINKNKGK